MPISKCLQLLELSRRASASACALAQFGTRSHCARSERLQPLAIDDHQAVIDRAVAVPIIQPAVDVRVVHLDQVSPA